MAPDAGKVSFDIRVALHFEFQFLFFGGVKRLPQGFPYPIRTRRPQINDAIEILAIVRLFVAVKDIKNSFFIELLSQHIANWLRVLTVWIAV